MIIAQCLVSSGNHEIRPPLHHSLLMVSLSIHSFLLVIIPYSYPGDLRGCRQWSLLPKYGQEQGNIFLPGEQLLEEAKKELDAAKKELEEEEQKKTKLEKRLRRKVEQEKAATQERDSVQERLRTRETEYGAF